MDEMITRVPAEFELHRHSQYFCGRETEVNGIVAMLTKIESEDVAVAILGPGGIGKCPSYVTQITKKTKSNQRENISGKACATPPGHWIDLREPTLLRLL